MTINYVYLISNEWITFIEEFLYMSNSLKNNESNINLYRKNN